MLRETLLERLNAELGGQVVKDLRFQVKPFEPAGQPAAPGEPNRDLTDHERAVLRKIREEAGAEIGPRMAALAERQMARRAGTRTCPKCGGPVRDGDKACPFCRP